jgi:hypothetical protein
MIPTLDREYYRRLFVKSRELTAEIERIFVAKCVADTIPMECPTSGTFTRYAVAVKQNPSAKRFLLGPKFKL